MTRAGRRRSGSPVASYVTGSLEIQTGAANRPPPCVCGVGELAARGRNGARERPLGENPRQMRPVLLRGKDVAVQLQALGGVGGRALDGLLSRFLPGERLLDRAGPDRKSTRLNSSHVKISYAVFCLK